MSEKKTINDFLNDSPYDNEQPVGVTKNMVEKMMEDHTQEMQDEVFKILNEAKEAFYVNLKTRLKQASSFHMERVLDSDTGTLGHAIKASAIEEIMYSFSLANTKPLTRDEITEIEREYEIVKRLYKKDMKKS